MQHTDLSEQTLHGTFLHRGDRVRDGDCKLGQTPHHGSWRERDNIKIKVSVAVLVRVIQVKRKKLQQNL